jgi:hypothetical protein
MPLPSPYVVTLQFGSSGDVDITSYVNSVSINKGISRQLDDYSAGTLSITFTNNDRTFDPLNTSSVLWYVVGGYTMVQPGAKVTVTTAGVRRFTGVVQSWDLSYGQAGFDGQATLTALDKLFKASSQNFTGGTQYVVESTSDRMKRVLNYNNFGASEYTKIESTQTPVGGDINNAGDNVLSYLQNLARTEPGDFFSNASAVLTFKDRSFTDYSWTNTTRQNLIKYPGTATASAVDGWANGYDPAPTTLSPPYGGTPNKSKIEVLSAATEMTYVETNVDKYNPDANATAYVWSGWFKAASGAVTVEGDFIVYDESGASLGVSISTRGIGTASWSQISGTVTVASGVPAGVSLLIFTNGTTAADQFYGNGIQIERGTAWVNYFDGTYNPYASDATNRYDVAWLGDSYASSSGMTISSAATATAPVIPIFADANSQGTAYANGTGIPFTELDVAYGGEQLYNQVQVVGVNATALTVDTAGQTRYGAKSYAQTDNLTSSMVAPARIAAGLLGEFRLPEYRASAITVALEALTAGQQTTVLALELRDVIRVYFQPSATGSVVDKYYQILAINSNTDTERDHITFTVSSLDNLPIRLDSTFLSILDTDTLG